MTDGEGIYEHMAIKHNYVISIKSGSIGNFLLGVTVFFFPLSMEYAKSPKIIKTSAQAKAITICRSGKRIFKNEQMNKCKVQMLNSVNAISKSVGANLRIKAREASKRITSI